MKHHFLRRVIALSLVFSLTACQGAMASDALGWDLHSGEAPLSEGVTLTRGYFWSDTYQDLRTERYLTYTPNQTVSPTVAYGETLFQKATLSDMAEGLEEEGKRVVGGMNGDFFVVSSGQPLGLVVTEGILRSSSSYVYAVGFRADGTAMMGQPNLKVNAYWGEQSLSITGGVNKVRKTTAEGGGPVLLTDEIGTSTGNTQPGVDVILKALPTMAPDYGWTEVADGEDLTWSEALGINTRTVCQVEEIRETTGKEGTIPEGCYVLSVNGAESAAMLEKVRSLQEGDRVELTVTAADPMWAEAVTAVGGLYRLLKDGEVCDPTDPKDTVWTQHTARTAIGIKEDGTVIFYTLDGMLSGVSVGISCTQAAERLKELGCVDAICLDGGGSTTFGVTKPGEESFEVINTPRDGAERKVSNAIFLTTEVIPTGEASGLEIVPGDALLLAGTKVPLEAWRLDGGTYRLDRAEEVEYTVTGDGTVTDGVFIAGSGTPTTKVGSAQAAVSAQAGELTGNANFTIIGDPEEITLVNAGTGLAVTALTLQPGEQESLKALTKWRKLSLRSDNTCYTWSCDPGVGTVSPDGVFTAGENMGKGSLTVSVGTKTLTIPVTVTGHIQRLEDLEGTEVPFASSEGLAAEISTDLSHVRAGRQSLKLTYDLTGGAVRAEGDLTLPAGERYLGLWVYGDGSGNVLEAEFDRPAPQTSAEEPDPAEETAPVETAPVEGTDPAGEDPIVIGLPGMEPTEEPEPAEETEAEEGTDPAEETNLPEEVERVTVQVTTLNFTGWKHFLVAIPQGAESLKGLGVAPGEGELPLTGAVWVDHLTVSNVAIEDTTAPAVSVESRVGLVVAQVGDDLDTALDPASVTATYDGKPLEGTFQPATGVFTALLPVDEENGDHRITVTARDQSGNLGSGTLTVRGEAESPFTDMTDHWAASYANYLYQQKITSGVSAEGEMVYDPSGSLTRAQFFTMVTLWLGLDVSQYERVELPFADLSEIPDWALPYIKAVYAEGILAGSREGEALYARPNKGITRSEVMTILGLTQEKGGAVDDLSNFTDAATVPDWARSYVESLVGSGVIHGYEDGTLRPVAPMTRAEAAVVLYSLR